MFMSRGKSKKPRQAEKLLLTMLDGHLVTEAEIATVLGSEIEVYRLSTYLWNLKKVGADIAKTKQGRKVVAIQLTNTDTMTTYAQTRGLLAPAPVALAPEDFAVVAG
jgi:hypothetical protein